MSSSESLEGWIHSLTQGRQKDDVKGSHIVWVVFAIAAVSIVVSQLSSAKQQYVPGVPIVGGADAASIKKNRLRFVGDSMSMLKQGYQDVSIINTALKTFLYELFLVLRTNIRQEVACFTFPPNWESV